MKITLNSINFNYGSGQGGEYTNVNLNFTASGSTFNPSGHVIISKEEYESINSVIGFKEIIRQKMLSEIENAE